MGNKVVIVSNTGNFDPNIVENISAQLAEAFPDSDIEISVNNREPVREEVKGTGLDLTSMLEEIFGINLDQSAPPVLEDEPNTCPSMVDDTESTELDRVVVVPERFAAKHSPYHNELFPGVWIDVYAVLETFPITDHIHAHVVKKALQPGQRGHKDTAKDYEEIAWSANEALENYMARNPVIADEGYTGER
ncbi:hypothetical protein [Marinobacterium litorale]|uniref:hypothetical protein n=1 Tax=Marinobacterium litorale TaxID=404770 RepID=UPI0003FB7216|nr:hypothetical protein [Marinobacterium litorale]